MKKINKKAFTLIELLIVIAIIGILFIVLVSKVDFATDKAKASGVQTDFRSFQVALDTVAKENSGFNTFGYNTGDNAGAIPAGYAFETTALKDATIGDGIRNSYDQGDKNLNGKQDVNGVDGYTGTTEVFTGRKIYTENWSEVYTLVKPGTTGLDANAVFALESAINSNLDPKLHITISATDGKITMANQARDPWKNEYHGVYISQAERDNGADRGAIIIYSNGANGKWGSAHDITNGVVSVTVPGNNTYGKDDYSLVSCYTFVNGYGEVLNMSTGFSNNQSFMANGSNSTAVVPGGNGGIQAPTMLDGVNAIYTKGEAPISFRSSAPLNELIEVRVDDSKVNTSHYTTSSGSTIVTFTAEYLDSLSVGVHTLDIVSTSGTASTTFTINNETLNNENIVKIPIYVNNNGVHDIIDYIIVNANSTWREIINNNDYVTENNNVTFTIVNNSIVSNISIATSPSPLAVCYDFELNILDDTVSSYDMYCLDYNMRDDNANALNGLTEHAHFLVNASDCGCRDNFATVMLSTNRGGVALCSSKTNDTITIVIELKSGYVLTGFRVTGDYELVSSSLEDRTITIKPISGEIVVDFAASR